MISIGAVFRGPELKKSIFDASLMAATKTLNELRGPLVLGVVPLVNAVFNVPGSLGGVDFDGLQFGEYSKRNKAVVVKIAVPSEILESTEQASFIVAALQGANAMAFEFFRQQGESFPLREAEALVAAVSERLQPMGLRRL